MLTQTRHTTLPSPAVLGDLGLGLIKLAKFEDETGATCGQYSDWGAACKTMAADTRRVGMVSHSDRYSMRAGMGS